MSYQLSGAVALQDQTVNLTSAYTLPGGSYPARIRIDSETMLVRGGAGTAFLSVQRGVDGTAPATHAAEAMVYDDTDDDQVVGDLSVDRLLVGPDPFHHGLDVAPTYLYFWDTEVGYAGMGPGYFDVGGFYVSTSGPSLALSKDRGGSIVQANDDLGFVGFYGWDGDAFVSAGYIVMKSDGSPGNDDMPGRMMFFTTPDGAATPAERLRVTNAGVVQPGADNTQTLGAAAKRWSVVYAGTGTINTSDRGAKQDVRTVDAGDDGRALLGVARRLSDRMSSYRMKDAVAQKGDDARIHHGVTAQDVEAAFKAEGLDPARYGVWCRDEWPETVERTSVPLPRRKGERPTYQEVETVIPAGEALGVRYEELFALMFAGLNARVAALEERLGL